MDDPLAIAFDLAALRARARPEHRSSLNVDSKNSPEDALVAFARRVVAAGRRVAAAPACPTAVLARGIALADEAPRTARGPALLHCLFDSWATLAPSFRGPGRSRFLRYGGPEGGLDIEMVTEPTGEVRVRGTVEGADAPLSVVVTGRRGRTARGSVRAGGAFSATLPAHSEPFSIAVRSGRRTLFATGRIPPSARA